jgi:hypothetical protein
MFAKGAAKKLTVRHAEITRSCALNFVVGFSMAYSRRTESIPAHVGILLEMRI